MFSQRTSHKLDNKGVGQYEVWCLSLLRHTLVWENKGRHLHEGTRGAAKRLPTSLRQHLRLCLDRQRSTKRRCLFLGAQCGFDRWLVKILKDQDRELVDFSPVDETVSALNNLKRQDSYPYDHRANEELRVYRVRARLVEMRDEADSDLHLIISEPDQPDLTMIAEIPAPFCALGSGHEGDYETARADARDIPLGSLVEIEGVGFFDKMHDQRGVARNGFEIHPVLRIRTVQ